LSGSVRQGRIGLGGAIIAGERAVAPASAPTLELVDVDAALDRMAGISGPGSSAAKTENLRALLGRATEAEQDFLVRLLFGELRQVALDGAMLEAVARAAGIPAARIRRAAMMSGALAPVARAALVEGAEALSRYSLQLFQPVQPMLAESAGDIDEALAELGAA